MTKKEYLEFRKTPSFNLIYEYYKEHFKYGVHSPFLQFDQFIQHFSMWSGSRASYQRVLDYYDSKFEIRVLQNEDGSIIKYL